MRLEVGTSLIIPAGTAVEVAGDPSLSRFRLTSAVPASLMSAEDFPFDVAGSVTFTRGAYIRLEGPVETDVRLLEAGARLFLPAGTPATIVGKITGPIGQDPLATVPCEFPVLLFLGGAIAAVVVGGLIVHLLTKE
jgi:hypothetical protein